jgi:hypothetical protein
MPNLTSPPRGAEVWKFSGFKGSELVFASWAMRGAHETEAAVYLKMLADGLYDRVQINHEKSVR